MINYKEEKDLVGRVKALTGGEGVRVVFDSTGKDQFENDLEVVGRKGSIISYGNSVSASGSHEIRMLTESSLEQYLPLPSRGWQPRT
jgi:NADPH2:quinone reductase